MPMEHSFPLISTLAAGFGLAMIFGLIAQKMQLSTLVGYLLAGVVIGPLTPGFVADMELARQLSEIGVMLLMFGVGLDFALKDLMAVRKIAVPGAIVGMSFAASLSWLVARAWGWNTGSAIVFGLSLSCASTVVLLRSLEARGILTTMDGRIGIGWLVVEDLSAVLMLVLLPPLSGLLGADTGHAQSNQPLWQLVAWTLGKVAMFVALMLFAGRWLLPWVLLQVARAGSRELFTLSVIAIAIGIAFGASGLFDVSFALGAFFAGTMMRESEFSHRAAEQSLPLRDAFAVLFFVSVGMLFDPKILVHHPFQGLSVVLIILLGKPMAAACLVLLFRYPLHSALTIAVSLAQLGEFSFILVGVGNGLHLLPADAQSLIVAGSLITIAINPALFALVRPMRAFILNRYAWARKLEYRLDPLSELPDSTGEQYLSGQVVLVGYGRVGRQVADSLKERGIPFVVVDQSRERVDSIRKSGMVAVSGDAADPATLVQAHITRASMLVIAIPDPVKVKLMTEAGNSLNPNIEVVIRTKSKEAAQQFRQDKLGKVFLDEEELARGLQDYILGKFGPAPGEANQVEVAHSH